MFIFTHRICNYIQNKIIPYLIVSNNYTINDDFVKRKPYITKINIYNYLYETKNIYKIIIDLLYNLDNYNNNNKIKIYFINIICGHNDIFHISNANELDKIKKYLNEDEIQKINNLDENNINYITFVNDILKKYYEIKWFKNEIIENNKSLINDINLTFTDVINDNNFLKIQYFIILNTYPIYFNVKIFYNYFTIKNNMHIKYKKLTKNYYDMLFYLNFYFEEFDKQIYDEINYIIKIKYGFYKQLIKRIDIYKLLYENNILDINIAKLIIIGIILDLSKHTKFVSNIIKYLKKISINNTPNIKISQWYNLLIILQNEIKTFLSYETKELYFKYLNMIPQKFKIISLN